MLAPNGDIQKNIACLKRCASRQGSEFAECYESVSNDGSSETAKELRGLLSKECQAEFLKRHF